MIEDANGDSYEMWRAIKPVLPGTKKSTVSHQSLEMGSGTPKISLSPRS